VRTLLLLTALSLGVWVGGLNAQTLTGLPDKGITLSGSPDNPVLVNHSGKTIIGTVLVRTGSDGKDRIERGFMAVTPQNVIPDGGQREILRALRGILVNQNEGVKTLSAKLALVVFSDGQVVGPDASNSQAALQERLQATAAAGDIAHSGQWTEIQLLANSADPPDNAQRFKQIAARNIMNKWQSGGIQAAQQLGDYYRSLPTRLWR
jgi:hypothetical protein